MAITFRCQCGKRLRVRDEHAGKRAKCPHCGKPVTVPNKQADDSADFDEAPPAASPERARPSARSVPSGDSRSRPRQKARASRKPAVPIWVIGAAALIIIGIAFFFWNGGDDAAPADREGMKVAKASPAAHSNDSPPDSVDVGDNSSDSADDTEKSTEPVADRSAEKTESRQEISGSPFGTAEPPQMASIEPRIDESPVEVVESPQKAFTEPRIDESPVAAVESPQETPTEREVDKSPAKSVEPAKKTSTRRRTTSRATAGRDADDWAQFRGSGGSGISGQTGLPVEWSATENIVWKTSLPGHGASSPIVVGQKIFMTCYSGYGTDPNNPGDQSRLRLHVVCADHATGKIQWDKPMTAKLPEQKYGSWMTKHGYASSTPVSDGRAVYVFFGHTGVFAFSLTGKRLWYADVGSKTHGFGTGASPILYENLVIVNASVESENLVALDKKSGRVVWHAGDIRQSWNTPVLVDAGRGRRELVLMTQDRLLAFDPSNGKPLWYCAGSQPPRYICPSAIADNGIVYALHGLHGPLAAVRAGGRGDVTGSQQLWQVPKKGSNVPSPVLHDGHLYWVKEDGGIAYCVDAKSGKLVYQERLNPGPGLIYASPLAADGKLYYVSREKGTYVLAAKPTFDLLAHNVISSDDSVFNGSPAVTEGRLLLRSDRFLYCVGRK